MKAAEDWTYFLHKYEPIVQNGNMFDEEIQRTAKQRGFIPITFDHPLAQRLLHSFDCASSKWNSIILTGTTGDGKTHLCHQVWEKLGGDAEEWASNASYMMTTLYPSKGKAQICVVV